jgi:two-component system C4-dicarboxylate transport sensor histidine kinase DctB
MKNSKSLFNRVGAFTGLPLLASLIIGLLVGWMSIQLLQVYADARVRTELNIKLEKLQDYLSLATTRNRAMGVALLLGLNEPIIKRAALGETGFDAPDVLQRLQVARKQFDFEGMYIIDKQGSIIVNDTEGVKSTTKNIAFRPYFQLAMKGQESVYMAIGTNSDSRGLFVAAPIHETAENDSNIIGVISVKLSAENSLDKLLSNISKDALLISPQGVVFASSRKEWQLNLISALDEKRIQKIRELKQFGTRFENVSPAVLNFDPTQSLISLQGRRLIAERIELNWNDPNGAWSAVLLEDSEKWLTASRKLTIFGSILLFALLMGALLQQQVNRTRRLRTSLANENEARTKAQENNLAAVEERALIAKITAELRHAQNYAELVQTFMRHVSDLFGIGFGLLYAANHTRKQLRLVGGYGVPVSDIGKEVPYGEGLAGQCALEEKPVQINQLPANYIQIVSGSGAASPKVILLHPLMLKGELVGVVELASFNVLTSKQEKILAEFEIITAANIEIMEQRQALELEFDQQRASEESLRQQASLQQALIDTIPFPIFYKGPDCRFLGFNRAYEKTFNVKRENLIGKQVLDLDYLPKADRIAYQQEDERVIAEVGEIQREVLIPFADGNFHQTLYRVSGFRLDDGQLGGLVGIFIDLNNYTTRN